MSTPKHDQLMQRTIPITVEVMRDLAYEAHRLEDDLASEARAHSYTRRSLATSNEARNALVADLATLDVFRQTAEALRAQLDTMGAQLDVERAKHARATAHIAAMVRGDGWPTGRPNPWSLTTAQARLNAQAELDQLRAEVDRLTEGLANAHAAQGIAPLQFSVGDHVRLTVAHNDGVVGNVYRVGEAAPNSSLPYYLGAECQWVPAAAVEAVEPEPEPRPFKVGDRVERQGVRGIVTEDDGSDLDGELAFWVEWDGDPSSIAPYDPSDLSKVQWEPGERIEVGCEVEYVNGPGPSFWANGLGMRGKVTSVIGDRSATVEGIPGAAPMLYNLRRIS